MSTFTRWWDTASTYVGSGFVGEVSAAGLALLLLVVIWQAARRAGAGVSKRAKTVRGRKADTLLTFVVAGMATATSAEAMWNFFHHTLHIDNVFMRAVMFSMYEASMLVCALRARRSALSATGSAGVEGVAVWVLASLSGILAATAEQTFGGALARLAAPIIAAFLWERGLAQERKEAGKKTINWRLGPERLLVWLGLAEAKDRSVSEVDAHRRLTRTARAAMRVRDLEETGGKAWRLRWARRRLRRAMESAVEHAGLTEQPARQTALLGQIAALSNAQGLARLSLPAPWDPPSAPRPPLHVMTLTPLAFMPRPDDPDDTPDGDRTPKPNTRVPRTIPVRPLALSVHNTGVRPVPALVQSYGMSGWTLESLRRPEDKSGHGPEDKTGQRIDRDAFFQALDKNDGLVDRAIAELTRAGVRAPTRGYGYTLRRKWLEQKAQANGHLTRVK